MSSSPDLDESDVPPVGPVMFQAPRPGPGRPTSSTSTSEPPQSSTRETNPSGPAESSTNPDQDSSTRNPLDDGAAASDSGTSGRSLGSEIGAEAHAGLRGGIAAGIINATEAAHNALTDDVGRQLGQFLISDTEVGEIADRGARIIARKLPKGAGNPDIEDFIRVGVAVVAYVGRQFRIFRQATAVRRKMRETTAAAAPGDQPA